MDRPLGGRVNAADLVAYSLHVSEETMTDPANPENLACAMFFMLVTILLCTPGEMEHAILACQVALHNTYTWFHCWGPESQLP